MTMQAATSKTENTGKVPEDKALQDHHDGAAAAAQTQVAMLLAEAGPSTGAVTVDGRAPEDPELSRLLSVDLLGPVLRIDDEGAMTLVQEALQARLFDGQGETLIDLGPAHLDVLTPAIARLGELVERDLKGCVQHINTRDAPDGLVRADVLVRPGSPPLPLAPCAQHSPAHSRPWRTVEQVRLPPSELRHLNLRVAVIGNVDAGKSTLVGVLVGGALDNGRGSARLRVLRHRHEAETGRTSSISEDQHLGFDLKGRVLNSQATGSPAGGGGAHATAEAKATSTRPNWQEVVQRSSKLVSFIDLAGHEKYLKTTMFGMTAHDPGASRLPLPCLSPAASAHGVGCAQTTPWSSSAPTME